MRKEEELSAKVRNLLAFLLGIFLFSIPWDRFFLVRYDIPISPSYIVVFILIVALTLVELESESLFSWPTFFMPLLGLLVYVTLSVTWTPVVDSGLIMALTLWAYFGVAVTFYCLTRTLDLPTKMILWMFVIGVASLGIYSWFFLPFHPRFRIIEGYNPTHYAAYLAWAIVSCVFIFLGSERTEKVFSVIFFFLLCFFLVFTQARNSMLMLMVGLIIASGLAIFSLDYNKKKLYWDSYNLYNFTKYFVGFILLILIMGLLILETGLFGRLYVLEKTLQFMEGDLNVATSDRLEIWGNYFKMSDFSNIVGRGVQSGPHFYEKKYGNWVPPHNVYLLSLFEFGILGLGLWVIFLVSIIYAISEKIENRFLLSWIVFGFLIFGVGNDILYYKYWWLGLFVFLLLLNDSAEVGEF